MEMDADLAELLVWLSLALAGFLAGYLLHRLAHGPKSRS
jgi:hypothetical protein